MILESIASNRRNLFWTLAHIGLGFVCTLTPFVLIGWFYFILFSNFFKANSLLKKKKLAFFLMLFSYLISFELLDRMAKTSPFIPYELGKYLLVSMGALGLVAIGIRSKKGIIMALLVTPAVFYDFSGQRVFFDIINYYLGPLAVGLGIAFSDRLQIKHNQFLQILKFIWLTCVSSLIFTVIKTPDFENISFTLKAQFDTTGGHSSNQVSTVLGLGMYLSFYSIFKNLKFSGNRLLDISIFTGFAFQGLLSFSRGGMIVGALGILITTFFPEQKSNFNLNTSKPKLIVLVSVIVIYGVFELANSITGGNLLLRYKGETEGTLRGTKELTADQFVTGRIGIFEKDLNVWKQNFISGGGVGSSRFLRDEERIGVAPHIELSRLLADHGILGLFFAIYFFFVVPKSVWLLNFSTSHRVLLITLITIAIATTFHAAMRTYITPLLVILGSLKIKENQSTNIKPI